MPWQNLKVNYTIGAISEDGKILYCYDNDFCYISKNSGITFTNVLSLNNIQSISCSNDGSIAMLCGLNSDLYISNNYGNTWTGVGFSPRKWVSISCNGSGKNAIACNDPEGASAIYTSMNYGVSWGLASTGFYIYNAKLIKPTEYSLIGIQGLGSPKYLVSGNLTSFYWNAFPNQPSLKWTNIICSNNGLVIYGSASDTNEYIYKSIDGGNNWTSIGFQGLWSSIACSADGSTIVATINGGHIYTSTDYGINFIQRERINTWNSVVSDYNGLIMYASSNENLYKTTDGGISCFAKNTKILLSNNKEELVQNLKIDDIVKTTEGDKKIIHIYSNFVTDLKEFKKIPKDELRHNVPNEDLLLSRGHAIFIEGDFSNYKKKLNYKKTYYKNAFKINNLGRLLVSDCNLFTSIKKKDVQNILDGDKLYYYHFVLESDNNEQQYAVYSNGMLSESMNIGYYNMLKL